MWYIGIRCCIFALSAHKPQSLLSACLAASGLGIEQLCRILFAYTQHIRLESFSSVAYCSFRLNKPCFSGSCQVDGWCFCVYWLFYYVQGLKHGKLYYVQAKGLRMYVVTRNRQKNLRMYVVNYQPKVYNDPLTENLTTSFLVQSLTNKVKNKKIAVLKRRLVPLSLQRRCCRNIWLL